MRLLKIGRDAACDITLNSSRVSSLHAELTILNSGDILLEDKGSKNGTYVQNQPIQPGKTVNVRRGDAIRFADVELQWSQVPIEDNSGYKGVWGIGTNFHNDFQISGNTVSRFHATVKQANDGKFYIIDHSKNGTTVDGQKIIPNQPFRIKKSSAISCGGVPINLTIGNKIPWPSNMPKIMLAAAASILLLCGIGFGVWKMTEKQADDSMKTGMLDSIQAAPKGPKVYGDDELYAMYNRSVVMLLGVYHYEVTVGNWDMDALNAYLGIPKRFVPNGERLVDISELTAVDLVNIFKNSDSGAQYGGTGFFISNDGKLATNLHVVKPWLFDNSLETIRHYVATLIADRGEKLKNAELKASVSEVKVEGILDYIALIPQGETFDETNIQKCRVIAAGEDVNKDVALVQTLTKRLPTADCTIVELPSKLELSADSVYVGSHVYTIGFPRAKDSFLQREANTEGIKVIAQGGSINQMFEYDFGHNAATTGGASGSPIFNKYGKLVGVHHAGLSQAGVQGYNYGVKAKYVKELLDELANK